MKNSQDSVNFGLSFEKSPDDSRHFILGTGKLF